MKFTDIEIDDIASLSLHYSYEIVMNALSVVYKEYYMYEKTVNNLAGLMSTIIRAQFNNLKRLPENSLFLCLLSKLFINYIKILPPPLPDLRFLS